MNRRCCSDTADTVDWPRLLSQCPASHHCCSPRNPRPCPHRSAHRYPPPPPPSAPPLRTFHSPCCDTKTPPLSRWPQTNRCAHRYHSPRSLVPTPCPAARVLASRRLP